ncbi:MAG: acetate--CoA ligase family protein [Thermodesulfovibrionales bacterium]
MGQLDALFTPRSVAVVGASHAEEKVGGAVLKNLLLFRGRVYPVNPVYGELMGLRSYPSVRELPEAVDLAVVLRPSREVPSILEDLAGRARVAIISSSGFAEIGEAALQEEVRETARRAGIRVLGPNCMGIYNPWHRLDTLFFTHGRVKRPPRGNVTIVSQSGAILTSLLDLLAGARVGVSKALNYGNAADINESDLFRHVARDERTELVVSYVESVEDGRRFIREARELSRAKPLVVLKAGKSERGRTAAHSHTGRLAGRYEIFSAALRQYGIWEAPDLDALFDSVKALSFQRPARGRRVLVVTNGGGSGALAADECARQGLEAAPLPEASREKLKGRFPYFFSVANPFDLTAQVRDEDYVTVLEELSPHYDGFVVIALAGVTGITPGLSGLLGDFRARAGKPLVLHTAQGTVARELKRNMERAGIPVYATPEGAVRGLNALLRCCLND